MVAGLPEHAASVGPVCLVGCPPAGGSGRSSRPPQQPVDEPRPERLPVPLAEKAGVPDPPGGGGRDDLPALARGAGEVGPEQVYGGRRGPGVVVGADEQQRPPDPREPRRGVHAGVVEEVAPLPDPVRPVPERRTRQVLAHAEPAHRDVAEGEHQARTHDAEQAADAEALGRALHVADPRHRRADQRGARQVPAAAAQADGVPAQAVADRQQRQARMGRPRPCGDPLGVEVDPVAHARAEAAQPGRPGRADAAVVVGERGEAVPGERRGERGVVAGRHRRGRMDEHQAHQRRLAWQVQRGPERIAVPGGDRDRGRRNPGMAHVRPRCAPRR